MKKKTEINSVLLRFMISSVILRMQYWREGFVALLLFLFFLPMMTKCSVQRLEHGGNSTHKEDVQTIP